MGTRNWPGSWVCPSARLVGIVPGGCLLGWESRGHWCPSEEVVGGSQWALSSRSTPLIPSLGPVGSEGVGSGQQMLLAGLRTFSPEGQWYS